MTMSDTSITTLTKVSMQFFLVGAWAPLAQFFFSFFKLVNFQKKKKTWAPLQKAWAPSEIVTQRASPHVKKNKKNKKGLVQKCKPSNPTEDSSL